MRGLRHFMLIAVVVHAASLPAGAQDVPDVPAEELGEPGRMEPDFAQPDTRPAPDISVSPVPAPEETAAPAGLRVHISAFRFTGNAAIPEYKLQAVAAPYAGREINDADLQELLATLTRLYHDAGYRTSRAVVPDQDIVDGVITIHIVEGWLGSIDILGEHHFDTVFLDKRLRRGLDQPLNLDRLNDRLRVLSQDRLIDDLQARLLPGSAPGENRLEIDLDEGRRFAAAAGIANDRSPVIGGTQGNLEVQARNLFGRGDLFGVGIALTDGRRDLDVNSLVPLNSWNSQLLLRYSDYDWAVVEEPLADLDIETEFRILDVGMQHPVIQSGGRFITISALFSRLHSESFLNGIPFSLSPGAINGRTDVSAVRIGANWVERMDHDVVQVRLSLSRGIDALGSTIHEADLPDSDFWSLLTQAQWIHRFTPEAGLLHVRFNAQKAGERLLPLEKYAIGGWNSVRGYRRARFVRDNAWDASIEYRLPIMRLPIPGLSATDSDGQLYLALFADAGHAWNEDDEGQDPEIIYGLGPGLRWDINRGVRSEFYWGAVHKEISNASQDDIQDEGIHFALSVRQPF